MATMAGKAYCHSSRPTGRVPSSSVFCLLSTVIFVLFPSAKLRLFSRPRKRGWASIVKKCFAFVRPSCGDRTAECPASVMRFLLSAPLFRNVGKGWGAGEVLCLGMKSYRWGASRSGLLLEWQRGFVRNGARYYPNGKDF